MLEIGTMAPEFSLPDQNGNMHALSDYKGRKVILYFYPKDMTGGCTAQACNFRDRYPQIQEKGAVVLGVSKDSVESHKRFEEKHGLPFPLLADEELKVITAYDVLKPGKDICSYMEAFAALGYKPEQVTKIVLTHRHSDHSGELRSFPHAKIFVNADELGAAELQGIGNIVPVAFTDGAYYNFPETQIITPGVRMIKAKGHTNGNSIVIVENDGLFYMIHGDITYVDEALYENKLSVVFDNLAAARVTQDRIIAFIRNHPTVYCGTHTPQGYENLEAKRVMDLDNPVPTVFAEVDFSKQEASGKYVCSICGYVYDPAEHDGVAFEDLPDDWKCPRCKQGKDKFNKA